MRGKLPPNEWAIRKCCICQSKSRLVKIIFLRIALWKLVYRGNFQESRLQEVVLRRKFGRSFIVLGLGGVFKDFKLFCEVQARF
jgi:hypothetical protein